MAEPEPGSKPNRVIILDSGPIIKNTPPVSSLIAQADRLVTSPLVLAEIRDEATRTRVNTLLKPFLTIQSPSATSIKAVADFSRRTGDWAVLSKTDINVLALAYELECEVNGGPGRIRLAPAQKKPNAESNDLGREKSKEHDSVGEPAPDAAPSGPVEPTEQNLEVPTKEISDGTRVLSIAEARNQKEPGLNIIEETQTSTSDAQTASSNGQAGSQDSTPSSQPSKTETPLTDIQQNTPLNEEAPIIETRHNRQPEDEIALMETHQAIETPDSTANFNNQASPSDEDSDAGGWITPSNIHRQQRQTQNAAAATAAAQQGDLLAMHVATITTDFAMQNVLLQMNLTLLSAASLQRIRKIKSFALRCHACFHVTKLSEGSAEDSNRQFCARCGQATLRRVSCSTDQHGRFRVHLKKNFQWNTRGDRYSVPKPAPGSAGLRNLTGGGKKGWGRELVFAEDQKEFVRGIEEEKRMKGRDLMDEDYLPSVLAGRRTQGKGRPKVGAGRNVNSRKR